MFHSVDEQHSTLPADHSGRNDLSSSKLGFRAEAGALIGILLLAAFLRFWRLDQQGFGSGFYSAAIRSMQLNFSNFFFIAFDPSGFISIDKPPVALWVQAVSAKLFGFHGYSLLFPQAGMGVLTVGVVYLQIRRVFGVPHALIAALVLAVTPISIAVDRDNLPDPLLTLLLTLAAGALIRSAESASAKWLLASVALVGVAFNVKMLAAYVVLPTFYLVYLLTAPAKWTRKFGQLTVATVLLAAVSLSWSVIVDLTPKNARPYMGGSPNNSALDLVLGYNGLGRIFADQRPGGADSDKDVKTDEGDSSQLAVADLKTELVAPDNDESSQSAANPDGGKPRAWRFAGATLSEQITWLFPLAFFGTWAGLLTAEWRRPIDAKTIATLTWLGWLLTHLVVFSFAKGIFHDYYTVVMGPAVAALVGIGLPALWRASVDGGWRSGLLPVAFLTTAAWQAVVIGRKHVELRDQLLPIVFGGFCLGIVLLISSEKLRRVWPRVAWKSCGAVIGFLAAMIGPTLWSLSTMMHVSSTQFPVANVAWLTGNPYKIYLTREDVDRSMDRTLRLVEYLRSQRNGETYLVAAPCCAQVQSIIIHTGEPAITIGGFLGDDPVLTKDQFVDLVRHGKLRFMLLGGVGPGGLPFREGPRGGENSEIIAWVKEHGVRVSHELWSPALSSPNNADSLLSPVFASPENEPQELYDLKPAGQRLADASKMQSNTTDGSR